jgi:hypothetical protein
MHGPTAIFWANLIPFSLQGVPEGGYEQLLEGYRHPWHVEALGSFLKAAMATTKEACAAANSW